MSRHHIFFINTHTLYQCHLDKALSETLILHLLNAQDYNPFALDYFVSPIPYDGSCREPHISKKGPTPSISLQSFADKIHHLNSTILLRRPVSPPLYVPKSIFWGEYLTYFMQTETPRPASSDTSRWSCAACTGKVVSPKILDVHCCPSSHLLYVFYGILSILNSSLFSSSPRRWRRRTTKSSMSPRQQCNILFDLFQTVAYHAHSIYIQIIFYYRACRQSWLVQSLCIAFLKGSSVNSRDEQGKPISNFSNTVGCKIPRLPILRSRWISALHCAGGGR